jgi:diacylglycerol O-acyltransferase / wax synthase
MAGARLVNYAPISIALDGMGLNVTAFSYAGNMWLCAVSCREMLPDPSFFADCLRSSFARMQEAAAREAAFTVAEAAAIAAPTDERVIEGKVVRKTTRRRAAAKAKPAPRKADAKPASRKRRSSKSPTPETTA